MVERDSKTWRAVEAWADKELAGAREVLESPTLDERTSDALRGAITVLKELKKFGARPEK